MDRIEQAIGIALGIAFLALTAFQVWDRYGFGLKLRWRAAYLQARERNDWLRHWRKQMRIRVASND